jgi:hypothetical protein
LGPHADGDAGNTAVRQENSNKKRKTAGSQGPRWSCREQTCKTKKSAIRKGTLQEVRAPGEGAKNTSVRQENQQ